MKTPIIGITTSSSLKTSESNHVEFENTYVRSVEEAGASVIRIDPVPLTQHEAQEIVDGLDGLLLSGGRDAHPKYFLSKEEIEQLGGEDIILRENNFVLDEDRDLCEIPLINAALGRIPIFGICRGAQMLNVVLGGKLVMDIRTEVRHKPIDEKSPDADTLPSAKHDVTVGSGSLIAEIMGNGVHTVNSRHHQGFREEQTAESLTVAAVSSDGIVEAVESRVYPWVLAVQWHPERMEDAYIFEPSRKLFAAFVEAAARH